MSGHSCYECLHCTCQHSFNDILIFFQEIDHMILRMQEQGYNTVTRMAGRAFTYVSDFVMQTAIRVSLRDESFFTLKSIRDVVRWISHNFPARYLFFSRIATRGIRTCSISSPLEVKFTLFTAALTFNLILRKERKSIQRIWPYPKHNLKCPYYFGIT